MELSAEYSAILSGGRWSGGAGVVAVNQHHRSFRQMQDVRHCPAR